MACPSIEQLRQLQTSLNTAMEAYVATVQSPEVEARKTQKAASVAISAAAAALYQATHDPWAEVMDFGLRPLVNVAARVAMELNLFEFIAKNTSMDELSKKSGAEKRLIVRILRPLVVYHFVDQPTKTTYSSTAASRTLTNRYARDWIRCCFDFFLPAWLQIPKSTRQNSYHDITSLTANPSILAYGENFFDALSRDPKLERDFASAMTAQDNMPTDILPQYPFDQDLNAVPTTDPSAVFIVDVGGGNGRFLARIHNSYPKLARYGKNVLQDLASVVNEIPQAYQDENNFIIQAHDFFKPNPIKGARYYNLRSIMHDWPDDKCREILLNIRSAMQPGHSKVLIQGFVIKEIGYGVHESLLDMNMMILVGKERTLKDYEELLETCGFKIGKVVCAQKGDWKCIEALMDEGWKSVEASSSSVNLPRL